MAAITEHRVRHRDHRTVSRCRFRFLDRGTAGLQDGERPRSLDDSGLDQQNPCLRECDGIGSSTESFSPVEFHVVNFTDFITPGLSAAPGDPTAIASVNGTERLLGGVTPTGSPTKPVQSVTCATVDLMHDGWRVGLVALPESRDRYERLKATGGYSFTHVGQLTRIDGSTFSVQAGEEDP